MTSNGAYGFTQSYVSSSDNFFFSTIPQTLVHEYAVKFNDRFLTLLLRLYFPLRQSRYRPHEVRVSICVKPHDEADCIS